MPLFSIVVNLEHGLISWILIFDYTAINNFHTQDSRFKIHDSLVYTILLSLPSLNRNKDESQIYFSKMYDNTLFP